MENNVLSNFIWRFLERWGAQGVTLVVSIVLARILGPDVYGALALVIVFTTILQVFVDSGLGTALVQKKDADNIDFSSVFWFNIVMCVTLYILVFFCAPIIAAFYDNQELTLVIRVLSLLLIISGLKNIQQAYVSRNMMFKKFFFATLGGTVGAAVVGVVMALMGYGIWALVAQYLINALVDTIILWITVNWRPSLVFSFQRFKGLFSYGWKMLVSSLIDTVYNQLRSLIIGKKYTEETLGFYTKGEQFPNYAVQNINSSMNSVLLPVLSQKQEDIVSVKNAARKVIRVSSYIIWPMMVGLCVVADKFIVLLLGAQWLPAVVFMRVLCFAQVFQPLQTTNLSVIKALGRSDMHLVLEIIKKVIAITIVVISSFFGVKVIAIGAVVYAVLATGINSFPNKKLIDYSYREQLKDVFPFVIMSVIMGGVVFLVGLIPVHVAIVFIFQVIAGIVVYWILSATTKIDTYIYVVNTMKKIWMRKQIDIAK